MSPGKPPALAQWVMYCFGLPESNPALAGDLQEEFEAGRSRAWYWRQTLSAVGTEILRRAAPAGVGFLAQLPVSVTSYLFRITNQLSWNGKWVLAVALIFGLPAFAVFIPGRRRPAGKALLESLGQCCACFVLIECGSWSSFWTIEFTLFLCLIPRAVLARPVARKI